MTVSYQPGYRNPNNPNDTGRERERNGGTWYATNWDYAAGAPIGTVPRDAAGNYILNWVSKAGGGGGGGGGAPSDPFAGQSWDTFDPNKAPAVPGSSAVGRTYLSAVDAYKRALAQFTRQRQGLMTQYGYTGDIDPTTGVLKNTRVDPNNPYGEYQLNRRSNYQDYLGAEENRMSRGLGSKGLGAQMLNDLRFQWGGKDTATSNSLIDALFGVDSSQQEAYADMTNSYWQALLDATESAIEGGDFGYGEDDSSSGAYGNTGEDYYGPGDSLWGDPQGQNDYGTPYSIKKKIPKVTPARAKALGAKVVKAMKARPKAQAKPRPYKPVAYRNTSGAGAKPKTVTKVVKKKPAKGKK